MHSKHRFARIALTSLAATFSSGAAAMHLDYQLSLGLEHNDNVNLSENDPVSDNILEPMLGFNLRQDGSTVQASASGVVQYRDYLEGRYGNEFRSQLASRLNWTALPERLNFTVEDYLGVQPVNVLEPDAPSNQQQTNVFALGPTLTFQLGPTTRGQAELRYITSYAEKTKEFNSQRASGALRAIKDLSATSNLSANLDVDHIHYTEHDASPDYDRYQLYGRYARNWNKLDLTADLGYSWLRYSGRNLSDHDNPLGRFSLAWRATPESTLHANFSYQFSDSATDMVLPANIGTTVPTNIATGDATISSQAFLERQVGLGYEYRNQRATLAITPYYRKLSYVDQAGFDEIGLDQSGRGVTATLSWLLRPLLTIGLNATGENERYDRIDREDKNWMVTAFLAQQWSRHWSGRLAFTHYERDSTMPGQSAKQNIVFASITFTR